jgi:gas vesicle protein
VALLFAPASGDETREFLNEKAREGKARIKAERDSILTAVERGREAFVREHEEQV